MAHFAEVDNNNTVLRVLVVDNSLEHRGADFLSNDLGLGGTWIQTSYNNKIRGNFAGIGYTYDEIKNAFIAPKPDNAIGFDEDTYQWILPEITNEALAE
jgi:hypothetical protein